jgi:hypothetical protein
MKISGFTFVRNATKLAFPFKESILSILPIVDEYVIAYCEGDEEDETLALIESISSNKIKIIETTWDPKTYYSNTLYAQLSDIAKEQCSGDWLFYLQGDEVVHERYHNVIKEACQYYLNNTEVEGLLFDYKHFWGDFDHYFSHHGWYPREIRIIRNLPQIHSWRDAQSFRVYDSFESSAEFYLQKANTRKLKVAAIPCEIYHYGWVRDPVKMRTKQNGMISTLDPNLAKPVELTIDYGPLNQVPKFKGSHPAVMKNRIAAMDWQDALQYSGEPSPERPKYKHEKFKYRIRSWIELNLLSGREIGGFKNYRLIDRFKQKIV